MSKCSKGKTLRRMPGIWQALDKYYLLYESGWATV